MEWGKVTDSVEVPVNDSNRFAHIDALRAVAVVLVVLAHAGLGGVVPGGSGVTIFFSISGFIITFLLLREREKTGSFSLRGFYSRRFFKIAPPFVVAIIVPTLVYSVWVDIDWRAVFAQVFFVFNWFKASGGAEVLPGSGVVWSLSIEEQFYIVFALVWLGLIRTRQWWVLSVVLAGAAIGLSTAARLMLAGVDGTTARIYYGSDTRLDGIAWGMLLALFYFSWLQAGRPRSLFSRFLASDLSLAVAIGLYVGSLLLRDDWFRDTLRFTVQSISACLVIAYGQLPGVSRIRNAFFAVSRWKPVALVGLASYSIYLVHLIVGSAISPLVAGLASPIRTVILILVGTLAGFVLYYAVEVPVHRWRSRARFGAKARPRTPVG
jgi:peptidoglycan/LPS O-acetylase OafA/YrhL